MEKVFIKNRYGLRLSLKLTIKEDNNKLVFLEHGLGARKEYPHMLVLEEVFAANGYNVVNIDASNSLNESESSSSGVTFTGFYEDLEDVINWAKAQSFYKEPFALAGQSLGAEASILYAANNPSSVNLVVSAAFPFINGKEDVEHNSRTSTILSQGYYDQVSKSTGRVLRICKNYLDDFLQYDISKIADKITADTYLIVGLKDSEYHIQNNKKLYQMLKCKKQLITLPGVPHDLANTLENKRDFTNAISNILKEYKMENGV